MEFLPPTRTTTNLARGNAVAFVLSFAVVLIGMTIATRTSAWILVMAMGCLVFGWLLAATLITHLTSDFGLMCRTPLTNPDVRAFSTFRTTVRVQNPSQRWSFLFLTAELLAECDGNLLPSPPKFLGQIPAGSEAEFDWAITIRKRGEVILRGFTARTSFPGSLLSREFFFNFDQTLLILPSRYRLKANADKVLAGKKRASGQQNSNPVAMEEYIGVREYRPGDNPRNVSLTLSLRRPDYPYDLVIREFEDLSDDEVCVILDTYVAPATEEHSEVQRYRLEKSICFATAFCHLLCEYQHRVRFVTTDGREGRLELRINQISRDIPRLERQMARLTPTQDNQVSRRQILRELRNTGAVIVYLTLEDHFHSSEQIVTLDAAWQASLVREEILL